MMLTWLRFFGYKRTARTNKNYDDTVITPHCVTGNSRKSIAYNPAELYEDVVPLDGNIIFARRRTTHRRSAIDIERTAPSIDLGYGTRASLDSIPSRQHYLSNVMNTYANFATTHRGRHAKIVKAIDRFSGDRVALKIYDKTQLSAIQKEDVAKEIELLRRCQGWPGVVEFVKTFEDEFYVTLSMKDCTGGTLINRLAGSGGRMGEELCVRHVVKPLVNVLARLHGKGIVHRDLKPEHIVYDQNDELRLVDFVSAASLGKDPLTSREGTLAYMAPEVVTKPTEEEIFHEVIGNGISESDLPSYDEKADLWSLGVVIVEALTGRQPFLADSAEALYRIQKQELQGDRFGGVLDFVRDQEFLSLEGQDFLSSIFRLNPGERPSARELSSHPWLELLGSDDNDCQTM